MRARIKAAAGRSERLVQVRHLCTASREIKILALGQAQQHALYGQDYLVVGDAIWQRFNESDKRKHARYYWG